MPPKQRSEGKQVPEIAEVTEEVVAGTSGYRVSRDLTVLAREEAERAGIVHPDEIRDATQNTFIRSFKDYLERNCCCCSQSLDDDVPDSQGIQPQSFGLRKGKSKDVREYTRELLPREEEIELSSMETKLLQDAQKNIWEGHLDTKMVRRLMKTSKVKSSKIIEGKTLERNKITLECGIVGIFKCPVLDHHLNEFGTPEYEVAAYQISELLGLKIVPQTEWREIDGKEGSFGLWVNNLKEETTRPPNDALFFDFIIDHKDRMKRAYNRDVYQNWGRTSEIPCVLYDNEYAFKISEEPYIKYDKSTGTFEEVSCILPNEISHFIPSPDVLEKAQETRYGEVGEHRLSF